LDRQRSKPDCSEGHIKAQRFLNGMLGYAIGVVKNKKIIGLTPGIPHFLRSLSPMSEVFAIRKDLSSAGCGNRERLNKNITSAEA
jgi:hypothetical protein